MSERRKLLIGPFTGIIGFSSTNCAFNTNWFLSPTIAQHPDDASSPLEVDDVEAPYEKDS
jgi:hypothetical protein